MGCNNEDKGMELGKFHYLFFVKDLITKEVLLSIQSMDGLYVISEFFAIFLPQALIPVYVSVFTDTWYHRLGHPSLWILSFLVSNKKGVMYFKTSEF